MVGGIVLFAFGHESALHHTGDHLAVVPAFGLTCGIALYLAAHVAVRLRIGGGLGRGRPVAAVVSAALLTVATQVPAAAVLALLAAVCVALIAYEVVSHREERAAIRAPRRV